MVSFLLKDTEDMGDNPFLITASLNIIEKSADLTGHSLVTVEILYMQFNFYEKK